MFGMSSILMEYAKPTEIWFRANATTPEAGMPLSVETVLFYPKLGIIVGYTEVAEKHDSVLKVCSPRHSPAG